MSHPSIVVAERVRLRLRAEGTDPSVDADAARHVALAEVRRFNDAALSRGELTIDDEIGCVRDVLAAVSGFGCCSRCSMTRPSTRSGRCTGQIEVNTRRAREPLYGRHRGPLPLGPRHQRPPGLARGMARDDRRPELAHKVYELLGGETPQEWAAKGEDNVEVFSASSTVDIIIENAKALCQRMLF